MGSLERVLEQDVARKTASKGPKRREQRRHSTELPGQEESSSDEGQIPEDEKDLEMTPMATTDAAYENDVDEDVIDLGVRVGKMRMTERLGGFFRPKLNDELSSTLSDPSRDRRSAEEKAASQSVSPGTAEGFLEPGPTYLAPNSAFVIGEVSSRRSIMDFLPSKDASDQMIDRYYQQVHFIAKVVHWPSFKVQYENFWTNVMMGIEPAPSAQALMFSVMFSATAAMTEAAVNSIFSRPKKSVVSNFQTGTEVALGKAQFLRATKIETLQALVIYLIPMCRGELSRAHSVLVGTAIRLGECMGLHRDPGLVYNMAPVDCQVRRTLWFQLCYLDFRTADGVGPRPALRRDDYDTRFPLNINDKDLLNTKSNEVETAWTDMTFTRMRLECNEMHRIVWYDRIRLEKKQISLTHVVGKIESFKSAMEAKYHSFLDANIPIQRLAKLLLSLLLRRMHIMVLHRYHNSTTSRIPDRLRQVILTTGTQSMEDAVTMETSPDLAPWRWYTGAYNQWATAFLLLVEIFNFPMRKEADRIWAIVDYVFEPDLSLTRAQKGRAILSDLRDRLSIYRDIRKLKAPVSMMLGPQLRTKILKNVERPPSNLNEETYGSSTSRPSAEYLSQVSQVSPQSTSSPEHSSQGLSPQSHHSDKAFHTWTYDEPSTLFIRSGMNMRAVSGASPRPTNPVANTSLEPQTANTFGMGSSPSEISTSDSWPPFISSQQQGWLVPYQDMTGMDPIPQIANVNLAQQGGTVGHSFAMIDAPMTNTMAPSMMSSNPPSDPMSLEINWVSFLANTAVLVQSGLRTKANVV